MWETIQRGWEVVSGTVSNLYQDSVLESVYEGTQSFLGKIQAEADTPLGRFATWGYNEFMGNRAQENRNLPKAQRVSRPGGSSGQALKGAGASDMGVTPTAAKGAASAMNARPGSPIAVTIQRLQSKSARGPIMGLTQSQISVKPRAK